MGADEVQRAAVRLFARRGYAATGIREIGREVGLNPATLYHYVGSKQELLVTIMRTCLDQLLLAGIEAVEFGDDPRVHLARLVRAHVGLSATNPATARVTDQELRALDTGEQEQVLELRDRYEALLADVVRKGARAGVLHARDPVVTRLALLEMCNGVAHWYRPDGRLTVRQVQQRFVELGCRLLGVGDLPRAADLGPPPRVVRLACEPDHPPAVTTRAVRPTPKAQEVT
ncbi:TetR/AcrR family transcriptional regulator [Nocardioides acrostichi]|uniref:TetR family transcriptional regulator n=1 Tax=Nocardioides acrostichi TaxID=2784339 RepID=A0A930YDS5_9ACTN|nr:TetR/AcrR family transcriptional regulator [Nocardioides acrostichi]MBF4162744.1 TetR family transcriptional regulator [Nocardioides acrostichi]